MELTRDELEESIAEMLAETLAKHCVDLVIKHAEYILLGRSGDLDDGPDVSDGHDHEGFPGGCNRFGHSAQNCPSLGSDVSEPLRVFDDGPWVWTPQGSELSGKDLDEAAYVKYKPFINNPPATQGDARDAARWRLIEPFLRVDWDQDEQLKTWAWLDLKQGHIPVPASTQYTTPGEAIDAAIAAQAGGE